MGGRLPAPTNDRCPAAAPESAERCHDATPDRPAWKACDAPGCPGTGLVTRTRAPVRYVKCQTCGRTWKVTFRPATIVARG